MHVVLLVWIGVFSTRNFLGMDVFRAPLSPAASITGGYLRECYPRIGLLRSSASADESFANGHMANSSFSPFLQTPFPVFFE